MKTIVIDRYKCVGCRNCEMACAFEKSLDSCESVFSNIKIYDNVQDRIVAPITCFHCDNPLCIKVCPAHAITRNEITNAIEIDENKCAGCKMCILSCPYGNIHFDHIKKVSHKCDLCKGEPRCVTHCISGALQYVDVDVDERRVIINNPNNSDGKIDKR